MPDTTRPLTERDHHKRLLKEEINKCMRLLDLDENNNPNNATVVTLKSETPSYLDEPTKHETRSVSDYIREPIINNMVESSEATSMSNLL